MAESPEPGLKAKALAWVKSPGVALAGTTRPFHGPAGNEGAVDQPVSSVIKLAGTAESKRESSGEGRDPETWKLASAGPIPRRRTVFEPEPATAKPAIMILSPVPTNAREEMLISRPGVGDVTTER